MKKSKLLCAISPFVLMYTLVAQADNASFLLKNESRANLDSSIFIQIFKQEGVLELYQKAPSGKYTLSKTYPICKFSGGLGPKKIEGDLKSPEGFYQITAEQLNPNSRYYRSINIGFPNEFDKAQGYSGSYLMIHGSCVSVGCYAMTDKYMGEIYQTVETALLNGQSTINVNIYPFKMTKENMLRYRNSSHYTFWKQLQPAYEYFNQTGRLAQVSVNSGKYAVMGLPDTPTKLLGMKSQYALTKVE
ncbi:murein L,D-transpeptidase family protein [Providencia vermicola]|uniref:L,D-transpeptidase family protein n=1 Tax=Providencia vermicola TaxID=333965 RepID=UPI001CED56ED|nr:murein L,D-transpeptidase family protein [Providencia vermicola]